MLSSNLSGCADRVPSPQTERSYFEYRRLLENVTQPIHKDTQTLSVPPQPLFKDVSPLKRNITVSFFQEHYENILFFLAYEAGVSLIIDPEVKKLIPPERERITLQMKNQPVEEILKKVCQVLDIHFRVERGVLHITPYEEKIFNLGFIPVVKEGRSALGGDVLGNIGQVTNVTSAFRGEFAINAQLQRDSIDIYSILETNLPRILSQTATFTINRHTGSLYVRDRPSRIKTITELIDNYKKLYKKQILIDAQIIEIELSKGHNLGVDWFAISNLLLGNNRVELNTLNFNIATNPKQPSFSIAISGQPNIETLINLLKEYGELKIISNPKIRVLHSQPALIGVGTTQTYISKLLSHANATHPSPETSSVFDGILLGITPFITDEDDIILHIVPIKSDLVELKEVKFGANYFITLPRVNLREMTSIIRARPNDLIVLGGLILDKDSAIERRIAIPILSDLFRSITRDTRRAELVILIRLLVL